MFRSSAIIRKLALNLAKVIFTLKHSVKLNHYYYAVVWQLVMEWRVLTHTHHSMTCCHTTA